MSEGKDSMDNPCRYGCHFRESGFTGNDAKNDKHDAPGIVQLLRCGWCSQVHVKSMESHQWGEQSGVLFPCSHTLRRTCCTQFVGRGLALTTMQSFARRSQVASTTGIDPRAYDGIWSRSAL